ncbi:hypothetical protein JMA_39240 (plasmid) [Jeotgalibacillus malaysiensis]|uniref:Uncharacterized protein n=1 Tax=Jeotgalibacillus malaysiensis TaxID=1508404 RepID=A0A0B5AXE9_9BACL|nr:hypothetical protein JMA_39240 [Jeotgalibacillus malaysiensis]
MTAVIEVIGISLHDQFVIYVDDLHVATGIGQYFDYVGF